MELINQAIYDACEAGDFQQASSLYRDSCMLDQVCGCSDKDVQCAARCLSARLTYLSLSKNDQDFHDLATKLELWYDKTFN